VFDGYLSFKILNKVSKTCFHDKVWKLHLYVKPKIPKNMKIKEYFRQNVIKRGEKIPPGYPRTNLKIPGFFYIYNPGIFYSGIFQASKSRDYLVPGFFDPGISRDLDIPSTSLDQIIR
jgi:hypothetical protein